MYTFRTPCVSGFPGLKKIPSSPHHPLDPLTAGEIETSRALIVSSTLYRENCPNCIFNTISLKEPPKSLLQGYFLSGVDPPPEAAPRKSFSILWDRDTGVVWEAVVQLLQNGSAGWLESFVRLPDHIAPPLFSIEDSNNITQLVRDDPRVIARCAALGLTDMSLIETSAWWIKNREEYPLLKRPFQVFLYTKHFTQDNQYAHPLDFVVIVDLVGRRVVGIEQLPTHNSYDTVDTSGNQVPTKDAPFDSAYRYVHKDEDKPIHIVAPRGPSYTVNGNEISWQKFKLRIGFNAREGLVLYNVLLKDGPSVRPLLYRASISEMAAVYGDPRPPYQRKYVFDEGEKGLGFRANVLVDQEDCLGATTFFNFSLNDNGGWPKMFPNSVCVTEEDAGILWKHTDSSGKATAVRSHKLVLTSISTIGNYDLVFSWSFYQDGSLFFNVGLTGIVSTNMMVAGLGGGPAGFGTVMSPQVDAQYHQHIVAVRLDTDVDGVGGNSVVVSDVVSLDEGVGSGENPYGNGFTLRKTLLRSQGEGRTKVNPSAGRTWIVQNPSVIHPYTKEPVGWRLIPGSANPQPMCKRDSPVYESFLRFMDYEVWVTKYRDEELFVGGLYGYSNSSGTGIARAVEDNPEESIEDEDIVLWHVFAPVHIPRVEDWPVMPVENHGVWFKPFNFYLQNPGLDVPSRDSPRTSRDEEL